MAPPVDTIAEWSITQLTRFVDDYLRRNPPAFLPSVEVDELTVNDKIMVSDLASFPLTFHKVGGTGEPAFANSWVNFAGGWREASFARDSFGFVQVRGIIKSGSVGSTAFTLPPGYRPELGESFAVPSNALFGRVEVFNDGTVVPQTPSSNTWVSLSGIRFKAK